MRTSTLFLSCITALLVVGAVAYSVQPAMAAVCRTLTAALAVAQ